MFDIGWTELMVIGIVALIVVGPKDLPKMFRTLGQMTAKMRGMAREFQRAMDDAADASGVKDVARDLRKATDPQGMGLDEFNKMRNWDPMKDDPKDIHKDKRAKTPPSDEDEAAMDQIAAEMDRLRDDYAAKGRAAREQGTVGSAPAGSGSQASVSQGSGSRNAAETDPKPSPTAPETADKGQA